MPELAFRLISLAAAVAYMTVRTVYERRLGRPTKAQQMRTASPRERRDLMVAGITMLPVWLYMLTPWFDFAAMGLPLPVRVAGLVASASAPFVLAASHIALGESWTPFGDKATSGAHLVTSGIYRFVRHPMYSSFFLLDIGLWALTSNWLGALAVAGMLWLYLRRVDSEERMLLDLFGDDYRTYASHVGRLVPGVGRKRLAGERLHHAA